MLISNTCEGGGGDPIRSDDGNTAGTQGDGVVMFHTELAILMLLYVNKY